MVNEQSGWEVIDKNVSSAHILLTRKSVVIMKLNIEIRMCGIKRQIQIGESNLKVQSDRGCGYRFMLEIGDS